MDPYQWLRERNDPRVSEFLRAENRRTEEAMAHTEALQEHLYQEMKARVHASHASVPVRIGEYWYFTRTAAGKQYYEFCRYPGAQALRAISEPTSADLGVEVLLDIDQLAAQNPYMAVGALTVSPDHRYLAYTLDRDGDEHYRLYIKDLATGALLADDIDDIGPSVAWAQGSQTLFYLVQDDVDRPYQVYRHTLGSPADDDVLVYQEDDERFCVSLETTKSHAYIAITAFSKMTSEIRLVAADRPANAPVLVRPREHGVEYQVEHRGEWLYILTNQNAKNFRLMRASIHSLGAQAWEEVIAHRYEVKLDRIELFCDHLVVHQRVDGLRSLVVYDLHTGEHHIIATGESNASIQSSQNPEFHTAVLRYEETSLTTPRTICDYDMRTRTRIVRKCDEVLGYDPTRYASERIYARGPGGAKVPVSLVYRRPDRNDDSSGGSNSDGDGNRSGSGNGPGGPRPCLLYGYGAYGVSIEPGFDESRLSLLDRGFIYAIAHVRGGGELGSAWYEDGRLLHKKNTFADFIAAMETLIAGGYTSPDRLVILGGSAGGLLVGAVVNMRPDLMRAAIAHVPFVDPLNTMLDPSLPLTIAEYEEWGDPRTPAFRDYIASYSPYDNVRPQAYPHLLITAGLYDPRVQYWEPAKWVARLRAESTSNSRLLLRTNMGAGHRGASGRYDRLRELAFYYAFILDVLGLSE